MVNRYLVQLLLLAVIRPVYGGGKYVEGNAECPGLDWGKTTDSIAAWGKHLPGDVTDNQTVYPGGTTAKYPKPPPKCLHGAGKYVGWTSTNGFSRHFTVAYDSLALFGEAKHGLWQWAVKEGGPIIWWCQLGGKQASNGPGYTNGHADDQQADKAPSQDGMTPVWEQIRKGTRVNQFGKLARAANLSSIATTAVRVHHVTGGHTWTNRGNQSNPYWRPISEAVSEMYVFEGHYKFPSMFNVVPCVTGKEENCGLLNTFIAVVTYADETENIVGLKGAGLHYGPDADLCPAMCGKVVCKCNAMLSDLAVQGFLSDKFTDPLAFLPVWINPWDPEIASPSDAATKLEGVSTAEDVSTSEVWVPVVIGIVALVMGLLVGFGAAARFYRKQRQVSVL